jgi:uncharacterized protein with NRDE domain
MCTVTIVPFGTGVRLVCNRDERRARPDALPPLVRPTSSGSAIYPIDPASGGSWIGVNDAGLVAALLNRTPPHARPLPDVPVSRGVIVPAMLACPSLDAVLTTAAALDCRRFEPFTAVVADRSRVIAFVHGGEGRCSLRTYDLSAPLLFTSSSLGDALVEPRRRSLFEQLVLENGDALAGQYLFHRHQWPDARHISVRMERADAATVSRTTIDLLRDAANVTYAKC